MTTVAEAFEEARRLHEQGRIRDAESIYRQILAAAPGHLDSLHLLGVTIHQQGKHREAQALIDEAIRGGLEHPGAYSNLGETLRALGQLDDAAASYRRALALAPGFVPAICNLGDVLGLLDRFAEGETCLRDAIAAAPDRAALHKSLGGLLSRAGRLREAEVAYLKALTIDPQFADALNGLGVCFERQRRYIESEECYRRALAAAPNYPDAYNNLGVVLQLTNRPIDAVAAYRRALDLQPRFAEAYANLGSPLRDLGDIEGSLSNYRRAVELNPALTVAHSNIIFTLPYAPATTGSDIRRQAEIFGERFGTGMPVQPHENSRDPARRLRVAYLSPDFRHHAVAFFMEAVLAVHDRDAFDVFCYSDSATEDATTARLRNLAGQWRATHGMLDIAFADLLRADRIDIAVDCAGHTGGNRLTALVRRPAPIQLSTIFAHGGTTGLPQINYMLGDPFITPPESGEHFTEELIRLPRVFAPFRPDPDWPAITPLPEGVPVFVCFADPARIGSDVLQAWRALLDRVPDARLLLKNTSYNDPALRTHWRERFSSLGPDLALEDVTPSWFDAMEVYSRVAVALDSFPATGATTTLIPLWMGVPVVTLSGTHAAQRFGTSLLANAGCSEFIASDWESYVSIAAKLAQDRRRLAVLRANLRKQVAASPVCDARGVTKELEQAYRSIWKQWCARPRD